MSLTLSKKADWKELLNAKARVIHQQIASLQLWVARAGGGEKMLEQLSAPYYALLHSIYAENNSVVTLSKEDIAVAGRANKRNLRKRSKGRAISTK